jgi:hypothetical protein
MIPTMILLGLLLGRSWWAALVTAAISWPMLLFASDVMAFEPSLLGAAALAAANAGVGVLAHQVCLQSYRRCRRWHSDVAPN